MATGPNVVFVERSKLFPADRVYELRGSTRECVCCAWNPQGSTLAIGSSDGCLRVYDASAVSQAPATVAGTQDESGAASGVPHVLEAVGVMVHVQEGRSGDNPMRYMDVTTLEWSPDDAQLVTGSYDGAVRIWASGGELKRTLTRHTVRIAMLAARSRLLPSVHTHRSTPAIANVQMPVFAVRWNRRGDCIAVGSVDKTATVWDAASGEMRQQCVFHTMPVLDVVWVNDEHFVTASMDHCMAYWAAGAAKPVKVFRGHEVDLCAAARHAMARRAVAHVRAT